MKALIVAAAIFLLALAPALNSEAAGEKVDVVVTINVLQDITQQIGGEHVNVKSLVTGLENPHTYSTTPDDKSAVENADLFVEVGMGLEPWVGQLSSDISAGKILVVSDNCTKLGSNPHVWMDPENGKEIAAAIEWRLERIDPGDAQDYRANLESFNQKVSAAEERAIALGNQVEGKGVITATPGFSYLLHRMNITEVATLIKQPGYSPSAADIGRCEDAVNSGKASAVIAMEQSPIPAVEQISQDTGAAVIKGTPLLGVLGISHYTDLITYNAEAIYQGILEGEHSRETRLLENQVNALGSQVMLLGIVLLFLFGLLMVEAYELRKIKRGDF